MRLHNQCNQFKSVRFVEGSALMITAVVVMAMVTISAVFLNDVLAHNKLVVNYETNYKLRYAVESGLEQVKYYTQTSAYTGTRNNWLMNNSLTTGKLAINNLTINNITVSVTLYDLGGGQYRAVASANNSQNTYRVAIQIKESQLPRTLARYAVATGDTQTGGELSLVKGRLFPNVIRGDVHHNGYIAFGHRGYGINPTLYGATVYGDVTATTGVGTMQYYEEFAPELIEGDYSTGVIYGTVNGHTTALSFPNAVGGGEDVPGYRTNAAPAYRLDPGNALYNAYMDTDAYGDPFYNVAMTLQGKNIKLEFYQASTLTYTTTLALPPNKLMYIYGDMTVKGDINGRLTVGSGNISIIGNIRYVDDQGDPAYILTKNGTSVSTNTASGVVWSEANGYKYEPNPNYSPAVPCNLTFQSWWVNVPSLSTIPYNMVVHATVLTSFYSCGWPTPLSKGNFRMFGSVVLGNWGSVYDTTNHYRLSNELIHDSNLISNPPEWYPSDGAAVLVPSFSAWRRY